MGAVFSLRLHRWLMQAVLWLVLIVTLGLAALVREYRLHQLHVELGPREALGEFQLGRPIGWTEHYAAGGLTFQEPGAAHGLGRKLHIRLLRTGPFVSPLEFLLRTGPLDPTHLPTLTTTEKQPTLRAQWIRIAGWPGILLPQNLRVRVAGTQQELRQKRIIACAILPWGQTILIELDGPGIVDPADEDLVRTLAESLAITHQPPLSTDRQLELFGNIRLNIPEELITCEAADIFRSSRLLMAEKTSGWLAVEIVPCVVLDNDPAAVMASLLLLRDPHWRPQTVQQLDPQTWLCLRKAENGSAAAAYLRTDESGLAILAEFRWDSLSPQPEPGRQHVQRLWNQLAASLQFPQNPFVQPRVDNGIAALQQLPGDLACLIGSTWPAETWEWYDESLPRTSRMAIRYQMDQTSLWGLHELDRSPPLAPSGRERCHWRVARDRSSYDYLLLHAGPDAAISHETHLADGMLRSSVRLGHNATLQASGRTPQVYLPGTLLPLVLGWLPYEPMILRSESILLPANAASVVPLVLILEPAFDRPKVEPDQKEAMRCWTVHVSGTGQSSRWYIDRQGRLDSISFADGVHLHQVEPGTDPVPPDTAPASANPDLPISDPIPNPDAQTRPATP